MASFLSLAPALSLFVFFFFFWLRHIRCHSWTHVDKLLTHGSFLPLCPAPCPGHSFHWLPVVMVSGSPCRLKKKKNKKKLEGLKAAILGTAGPGWSLLPPVPLPVTVRGGTRAGIVWGLELPVCQLITRGSVGVTGGAKRVRERNERENLKEKRSEYEREYDTEKGSERQERGGIGREVAASTAAPSITLIQAPIILFTHTHTHMNSAGELKHIKRHREQKKKKKRKSRIWRQLAQSLRQRTPPSSSSSSNPDTQRNWNKQEKTDQQCAHRIRVMQAEYLNR